MDVYAIQFTLYTWNGLRKKGKRRPGIIILNRSTKFKVLISRSTL